MRHGKFRIDARDGSARAGVLVCAHGEVETPAFVPLATSATVKGQTVFGVGRIDPDVCFVGEAPGREEDATGEPFVGPAGQLLTRALTG